MPDLPEDLRALLAERAGEAPAVPAPSAALLARVRRRRAVRSAAVVGAGVAGVVAVVGVAAAVAVSREAAPPATAPSPVAPSLPALPTTPAIPSPSGSSVPRIPSIPRTTDPAEGLCPDVPAERLVVAVRADEMTFARGCYRVVASTTRVTFTNLHEFPHNVAIAAEGGPFTWPALFATEVAQPGPESGPDGVVIEGELDAPLAPGDYTLYCQVHPLMQARLEVR